MGRTTNYSLAVRLSAKIRFPTCHATLTADLALSKAGILIIGVKLFERLNRQEVKRRK